MRNGTLAAGLAALAGLEAAAQTEAASDAQVFTPDDFTRFAPNTALDMVREIPGFSIEREDDDRGFGQASGNVLINGRRISGKSNDAVDVLGRIPASRVVRIELVDGATVDIPGMSGQVVNVISQGGGISGSWEWRARFREQLEPTFLIGEGSVSGETGPLEWTFSFESESNRFGADGPELVFDGMRNLTETRDEDRRGFFDGPRLSTGLVWNRANGDVGNFNAEVGLGNFGFKENSLRFPFDGVDSVRRLVDSEDEWDAEIGADYEFGLGPGRLKLIGLYAVEDEEFTSDLFERTVDGAPATGGVFARDTFESETIARAEYSLAPAEGRDWQLAVEGALNILDAESSLFDLEPTGELVSIELNNATTRVEERRAEATLTHGRRLTNDLTVQISLGGEYSEISQSGPAGLTRDFFRPKGFVSAAWKATSNLSVNARVEREVGQLNFGDFVSSVNLNNDNANAGNPELVPEQSWVGEIELDQQLGETGAVQVRVYGELIEDIIDRVPIGLTSEGPGNLPSAERYGVELNTTLKLDGIGWKGAQIELEAEARESRVTDPLTGVDRRISRDLVSRIFGEVRWDVPDTDLALTVGYDQFRNARTFRLDEINFFSAVPGFMFATIEHKDIFGLQGFIEVGNLLESNEDFTREVFEPRRDGALAFVEDRSQTFGLIFTIGLEGTF
ncbi:MAG: TonB-dependent receptor [Pseudomonadota bacterium]